MVDKIIHDAKVYTDIQGLAQLRQKSVSDPESVKKEVAKQFQSMLMQVVLRSARAANNIFKDDLFSSDQESFYTEMYDQQLALMASENNTDFFSQMIDKSMSGPINNPSTAELPLTTAPTAKSQETKPVTPKDHLSEKSIPFTKSLTKIAPAFNTPSEFIQNLWSFAKSAAAEIGVDPKVMLAQAALETNWGKKILTHQQAGSSFNLFNIKADSNWRKGTLKTDALEYNDGVLSKESALFRCYNSFKESFNDYIHFLKSNPRYQKALGVAHNAKAYIEHLQSAGFATDPHYAQKVLHIVSSKLFSSLK